MRNKHLKTWLWLIFLIVFFREFSVWFSSLFGMAEIGNLLGLFLLLFSLLVIRYFGHESVLLLEKSQLLLKDSAFAFLPIATGSIILLWQMGSEIWLFMAVLLASTLFALWLYAVIAAHWLKSR